MPLSGSRRTEALCGMPPRRRRWRIRLAWLISLLIHGVVILLLLVTIRREEKPEQLPPPSAVTMLFDSGRKQGPTLPNPTLQAKPASPSAQVSPPVPPAAPNPPSAAAPPVATPPPVPAVKAAPPPEAKQQPRPAVKPEPPAVPEAKQEPTLPPPEAKPAPARQPAPARPPSRRPAPAKPSDFPAPMNFSFGKPLTVASSQARRQPRPHIPGTIDMSLGPAARGAADNTPFSEHDKQASGADWRNALSNWVAQHAYYPNEAPRNGDEGDAQVRVVAAPNGRVETVELVGKSGSMWLDLALLSLFRDQHIPPLPDGSKEPIAFDFTMHYILIRPR